MFHSTREPQRRATVFARAQRQSTAKGRPKTERPARAPRRVPLVSMERL
jgi:hypothetical protein